MLGDISGLDKIYIICGRTDMRKSIDGLCSIVQDQLKMNPDASALFLFCGREDGTASKHYSMNRTDMSLSTSVFQ